MRAFLVDVENGTAGEVQPVLVGNLLVLNIGDDGEEAPLHDLDFERIRAHLLRVVYGDGSAAYALEVTQ